MKKQDVPFNLKRVTSASPKYEEIWSSKIRQIQVAVNQSFKCLWIQQELVLRVLFVGGNILNLDKRLEGLHLTSVEVN